MNAVRWSESGARTTGISVVQMKVTVAALGALIAGIGGGLLAVEQAAVVPNEFSTFLGVIWLAVLVTVGIRSTAAALVAGISFVMLPALAQAYLPSWTGNVPPILFGLGAVGAAKFPEGTLAAQGHLFRRGLLHLAHRTGSPFPGDVVSAEPATGTDQVGSAAPRDDAVMVETLP
jgi:branched-chain amino acid transport system permease protein